jgi:hemerythrin superfamily protein
MARRNRFSLMHGLATFAGGAVTTMFITRILPPIIAQAAGSARARAGRDPFSTLVADHRKISSLLTQMEQTDEDEVFKRTQLLLRLKRKLTTHALAEEDVVYPMLHQRDLDDVPRLYRDHADMKMHLFTLEQIPKNDTQWLSTLRELKTLVEDHVQQEEEVAFPRLRDALDRNSTKRMSATMWREKSLML